jgi:hypothetical protein
VGFFLEKPPLDGVMPPSVSNVASKSRLNEKIPVEITGPGTLKLLRAELI